MWVTDEQAAVMLKTTTKQVREWVMDGTLKYKYTRCCNKLRIWFDEGTRHESVPVRSVQTR